METYRRAVVGLVEYNGQVLVARKKPTEGHHLSNEWHIPGGKADLGETDEKAVIREINEEAGINVSVVRFLCETTNNNFKVLWYLCSPLTHNLKAGDDVDEVKYVEKSEVKNVCSPTAVSLWPREIVEYLKA